MEKYIYRPVRFYLITFACTWFWWLFAILLNEGTGLYLGMFLGLVSPAVVAVVTVFTSKNKALINDFKKKLIGFYRIKPKYILIAVLIFAVIVTASIGTSVLFGGSINQFSFYRRLFIFYRWYVCISYNFVGILHRGVRLERLWRGCCWCIQQLV